MSRPTVACPILLAAALLSSSAQAQVASTEANLVESAATVLNELSEIPLQGIPHSLLASARGVVICPNVVKAGFVLGGRAGRGVLLIREPNGGWSPPVFLRLSGGSIGFQAGVESTDVVLVLQTDRSVQGLLTGRRFTLGANASVSAGPVGREAAASTDLQLQSEIYSYSRSRGLFAGVSLNGTALRIDEMAGAFFYQSNGVTTADILAGRNIVIPPSVTELQRTLMQNSVQSLPPPMVVPAEAGLPPATPLR